MWLTLPPRYEYLNVKLENVVKAAVLMVATQIAMEPLVRQTVREIFQERATISVRPSPKVSKEIGEDLEIFSMK
jgi:transcription elongation factor SPT6